MLGEQRSSTATTTTTLRRQALGQCHQNDEVRQEGTTSQLIFDVLALVSYISHITTLTTGDLIFTGTPDGVGVSQGKLLQHGDVITSVIQDIGTMTNRCVRISDYATP